jgi:tetratricopeptide (TPR) repeat protein
MGLYNKAEADFTRYIEL